MFDFDATLPLMAVQFLILMVVLNAIFYKPLTKALEERDEYILSRESDATSRLTKAEELAKQYEQELAGSRKQAGAIIAEAQAEADKIAAQQIAEAGAQAQKMREEAQQELDKQKEEAMRSLEQQVDALSRQILEKLLGAELANN